ncbi:hypothetical protein ANCDUO_11167 [Ancylostoma duodenale]|uniref:Uncharacterized protein n=1 Tax=Ancylostoma duodenale TaxID=51022 RepID=A0A0C2CPE4_9BILA|nr:hypothetical protein ANCDUO_11167 [Ancylostoma duodenale]
MCDIVQCAMRPRRTRRCTFVCRPRRTRWPPGTARTATTRSESRFGTSLGQLLPHQYVVVTQPARCFHCQHAHSLLSVFRTVIPSDYVEVDEDDPFFPRTNDSMIPVDIYGTHVFNPRTRERTEPSTNTTTATGNGSGDDQTAPLWNTASAPPASSIFWIARIVIDSIDFQLHSLAIQRELVWKLYEQSIRRLIAIYCSMHPCFDCI